MTWEIVAVVQKVSEREQKKNKKQKNIKEKSIIFLI